MSFSTEILNFINDNYLKLIIGLVLILMAIIGYYAEKTNFGNKLKKDEKKESEKPISIENIGLNDFVDNNSMVSKENVNVDLPQNQGYNNEINSQLPNLENNETVIQPIDNVKLENANLADNKSPIQLNVEPTVENNSNMISNQNEVPAIQQELNNNPNTYQENSNIDNNLNVYQEISSFNNNNSSETIVSEENPKKSLEDEFKEVIPEEEKIDNNLIVDINNMKIDPLKTNDISDNNVYAKFSSNINLPEINDFENDGDIWKF